jgi:hypothetical protein
VTADTTENLGSHVKYVRVRRRGALRRNVHVYVILTDCLCEDKKVLGTQQVKFVILS